MPLISHRGAAGLAPENSLESITIANRYKPKYIEVDLHRTIDGVFIIFHGALKQTLSGAPRPETFEALKAEHPYLATLNQALKHRSAAPLIFDIKCTTATEELIKTLKSEGAPEHFGFTSPHPGTLYDLKKAFPGCKTFISQPYWHGQTAPIELARDYGFSGVTLNKWWLNPFSYWLCGRYGKEINAYTINHGIWIRLAQKFYPRAYITTNFPNRYRKYFPLRQQNEEQALLNEERETRV